MYYAGGAARMAGFIAAFKFLELLLVPPIADQPRLLVAAVLTFKLWGAGMALGTLWLLGRVSQRLFGWPAPEPAPEPEPPRAVHALRPVVQTEAMRLSVRGNTVVLWWFVLGFLAVVMMVDTGAGPLPRLLRAVFGPSDFLGLETFVLGVLVLAAPLLLLAVLPRQAAFPLLASMQDSMKPARPRARRRRRP